MFLHDYEKTLNSIAGFPFFRVLGVDIYEKLRFSPFNHAFAWIN